MYSYDFKIAGKVFRLNHCQNVYVNSAFKPFLVCDEKIDCTINFKENEKLIFQDEKPLFSNVSFEIQKTTNGLIRQYLEHKENDFKYAINRIETDGKNEYVEYLPEYKNAFNQIKNSFSHIAIEELLFHHQRMILHSSFVETEKGGILFFGPSGIGKSTQAELWKKYENSQIINGDRSIIGKEDGVWMAWGSPYAGSSGYHIQKASKIQAIVKLSQGKENIIEQIGTKQAFMSILSEITMNNWNSEFTNKIMDMVINLTEEVPIYHLKCTADVNAVKTLKNHL